MCVKIVSIPIYTVFDPEYQGESEQNLDRNFGNYFFNSAVMAGTTSNRSSTMP